MDEDFDIPAAPDMNDDLDFPDETVALKVGEEKEIGNQGLKKKLLKEGEGWVTPENGDEVEGMCLTTSCCRNWIFVMPFIYFSVFFLF